MGSEQAIWNLHENQEGKKCVKRIAVFGGAFDPLTIAHERIVEILLKDGYVEGVLVVPCHRSPLEKQMAPFTDRLEMCRLAFKEYGSHVLVSDVACEVGSDKTIDLVELLRHRSNDCVLLPVIGLDEAKHICDWYRWADLLMNYKIIVFERVSDAHNVSRLELFYWKTNHVYVTPYPPVPCVSSTDARRNIGYLDDKYRCGRWRNLGHMYDEEMSGIISRSVFDYAVANNLYRRQVMRSSSCTKSMSNSSG